MENASPKNNLIIIIIVVAVLIVAIAGVSIPLAVSYSAKARITAENQTAANEVIRLIDDATSSISTFNGGHTAFVPTPESKQALEYALRRYNELTDEQKTLVTNYDKLESALQQVEDWEGRSAADQAAADEVIKLIDGIELDKINHKASFDDIRKKFDALTPEQQKLITNQDKLFEAENILETKKAKEAQRAEDERNAQREADEDERLQDEDKDDEEAESVAQSMADSLAYLEFVDESGVYYIKFTSSSTFQMYCAATEPDFAKRGSGVYYIEAVPGESGSRYESDYYYCAHIQGGDIEPVETGTSQIRLFTSGDSDDITQIDFGGSWFFISERGFAEEIEGYSD